MFKCCFKTKEQKEYLLHKKTCPYCNFVFKNEKQKNKHIKNCLYKNNAVYGGY
tara:strand:+ start:98 stop:256 length:159 start_codon:yes stop_codon:yes gene_type:complete